jgi:hypothetical protein
LYTLRRNPKLDKWETFVEKFKTLLGNVQQLIIKKLHGGMEMWCIQLRTLIIDTTQLIKYRIWLPIIVCLLTLISIKKVATYYIIKFHDRREFTKLNINVLVKTWIPCDLLRTLRFLGFEYTMRLKGNEKYCPKEIESKELWSTIMILDPYKNRKVQK